MIRHLQDKEMAVAGVGEGYHRQGQVMIGRLLRTQQQELQSFVRRLKNASAARNEFWSQNWRAIDTWTLQVRNDHQQHAEWLSGRNQEAVRLLNEMGNSVKE